MLFKKVFISVIVIGLFLTACAPLATADTSEIRITLTDFEIKSSVTEFKAGVPYHFVVTNEGPANHEIMLMPPLMQHQGMSMNMEELDTIALAMIEADDLPAGATASFDYTFTEPAPAGNLEFACHTSGHYEAGMNLPIIVK